MTMKKYWELLAMAERLGIKTAVELVRFKKLHGAETNAALLDALFAKIIQNDGLKGEKA